MKRLISSLIICLQATLALAQAPSPAPVQQEQPFATMQDRFNKFVWYLGPEKVYLHIDRTYFSAGETLWFNGYVRNSSPMTVMKESNYIYVEMLDATGKSVLRVKSRRSGVCFPGHMDLPEEMEGGTYTLRAYTLWGLNTPTEQMFHQSILVFSTEQKKKAAKDASKTPLDVTFYPEGGRYFANMRSTVGVKVMNSLGEGVDIKGQVVDSGNNPVYRFSTEHEGMGAIMFIPSPGEQYRLALSDGSSHPLPPVSTGGAAVGVGVWNGNHVFTVTAAQPGIRCHLVLRDASNLRSIAEFPTSTTPQNFIVGDGSLSSGINHAILTDMYGNILSERLFYVYGKEEEAPLCTFSTAPYEKTDRAIAPATMTLSSSDGKPLSGQCSVSIVKGVFRRYSQKDNLISYMNLSGELKGEIADPNYYFDRSVPKMTRDNNLDLLMLIQGWRLYDLPALLSGGTLRFQFNFKEYMQFVTGKIKRTLSSRMPKNFTIYVIIPRLKHTNFVEVDQGNSFIVDSLEFRENTGFLIKVERMSEGLDYIPKWDGDTFAPDFKYAVTPGSEWLKPAAMQPESPFLYDAVVTDTLAAAVVTASADEMFGHLGSGRSISSSDLKMFKDNTIIEYLTMKVPHFVYQDEQMYNTRPTGGGAGGAVVETVVDDPDSEEQNTPSDSGNPAPGSRVKLVVDESEEDWAFFEMLPLSDVTAISYSTMPDAFYSSPGGVVFLKPKPGYQIGREIPTESSLLYFMPLGYQQPRRFYAPVYDKSAGENYNRNTVFWEPELKITDGKAEFSFIDTTAPGQSLYVRFEGVTSDGEDFSFCKVVR